MLTLLPTVMTSLFVVFKEGVNGSFAKQSDPERNRKSSVESK
ncbi:hypothetical protein [Cyclobacterium jeungdonense]|uniref:Uncharacterized protein n=1 Tax=Cyclobacterium jeungdonense TaxID=708087 RepID=A0ABT8CAW7_9BACT|nr:hypothetical protein [Cyclobacterium jeungdonense]MDN3689541.1 hypothetical protein [Cyclobacterium jeungdonense]